MAIDICIRLKTSRSDNEKNSNITFGLVSRNDETRNVPIRKKDENEVGILLSVHHESFGSSLVIEEIARDSPLDCSLMSADRPSGRQHTCNEPELMDRLHRSNVTIGDHRKFHASVEHPLGLVERNCQSPSLLLLVEAAAVHHHLMNNPSKRNVVHKDR